VLLAVKAISIAFHPAGVVVAISPDSENRGHAPRVLLAVEAISIALHPAGVVVAISPIPRIEATRPQRVVSCNKHFNSQVSVCISITPNKGGFQFTCL
jgi:hypothetical protein